MNAQRAVRIVVFQRFQTFLDLSNREKELFKNEFVFYCIWICVCVSSVRVFLIYRLSDTNHAIGYQETRLAAKVIVMHPMLILQQRYMVYALV